MVTGARARDLKSGLRSLWRWFTAGLMVGFAVSLILSIPPIFFPRKGGPPPRRPVVRPIVKLLWRGRDHVTLAARPKAGVRPATGSGFSGILLFNLYSGAMLSYGLLVLSLGILAVAPSVAARARGFTVAWMDRPMTKLFSLSHPFRRVPDEGKFVFLLPYLPLALAPHVFMIKSGLNMGLFSLVLTWRGAIWESLLWYALLVGPHGILEIAAVLTFASIPLLTYYEVAKLSERGCPGRVMGVVRASLRGGHNLKAFALGVFLLATAAFIETHVAEKIYLHYQRVVLENNTTSSESAPVGGTLR